MTRSLWRRGAGGQEKAFVIYFFFQVEFSVGRKKRPGPSQGRCELLDISPSGFRDAGQKEPTPPDGQCSPSLNPCTSHGHQPASTGKEFQTPKDRGGQWGPGRWLKGSQGRVCEQEPGFDPLVPRAMQGATLASNLEQLPSVGRCGPNATQPRSPWGPSEQTWTGQCLLHSTTGQGLWL